MFNEVRGDTVKLVSTESLWDGRICSVQTGVWFTQVQISQTFSRWDCKVCLVQTGFGFTQGLVQTGFGFSQGLVQTGITVVCFVDIDRIIDHHFFFHNGHFLIRSLNAELYIHIQVLYSGTKMQRKFSIIYEKVYLHVLRGRHGACANKLRVQTLFMARRPRYNIM